jgi:putative nucleotidyltransferase with HDIG domain
MLSSPLLPKNGRAYVSAVILAGFLVVAWSVHQLAQHPVGYQWFLLAALTLISGSATVKLPSVPASISISETFVFAAVLLYGPAAGTLIVALDGLVISFWISRRRQEPYRALFNMSAPAVSAWASSELFFWIAGVEPLVNAPAPLNRILPALILFAIAYFSFNSWLIAFAISLEKRVSPVRVWRENFIWLSINYFCGASVAVLLVGGNRQVDLRFIGVIVPLLLVLYFTFKTSMDRVEDANRHVEKVNRLYLSTIETLAMAIDAKDQVTHGHIRRVQRYAVGLARELGVADEALIKAIEAAALLHDMGKLAVPEYILNKPGRLTEAEFEKMKLHASVGADILSAIDFPYPVVPIVRHHHESWDGSGYPDGLRGTDIPIGARILSVVDCFDALTSDRPYRRRLSDDEALQILNERKGTMYDPWVVHTFERVHASLDVGELVRVNHIAPEADSGKTEVRSLAEDRARPSPAVSVAIDSVIALECEALLLRLRPTIPAEMSVFYRYDSANDVLVAHHLAGDEGATVAGTRVELGQNLSGWVAANRQVIVNSDAALDLGELVELFSPKLQHCLSVPVNSGSQLIGVLTLYSANPFTQEDEQVCRRMVNEIIDAADVTLGVRQPAFALHTSG